MLRFLHAADLAEHPRLADEMFRHRAIQFRDRLGWPVDVDDAGHERDQYDAQAPLYVIWETAEGGHGGSARFLPTTGRTMAAEHFAHLTGGGPIRSESIWECTRFCLAPGAEGRVGSALMLGGAELMRRFDLTHLLGVFDMSMPRVYRIMGSVPEVLGSDGQIGVGLWHENPDDRQRLLRRARVGEAEVRGWSAAAFGAEIVAEPARVAA